MENQLVGALLLENNKIEISYISEDIDSVSFSLVCDGKVYPLSREKKQNVNQVYTLTMSCDLDIELGHIYKVKTSEDDEVALRIDKYVATKEFENKYAYDGELGIKYSKKETEFRFWSPLSENVYLKLEKGTASFTLIPMKRGDRGVYFVSVKGDIFNKKYKFVIYQNNIQKEILDPYGKAVDANSNYSVVIDINDIKTLGNYKPKNEIRCPSDAIIYELHVRDFTEGDKSVSDRGTYLAILDKVDYLKNLGITHVQLLPVIDFGGVDDIDRKDYNWGYNPISFFALEGSYSKYPEDGLARLVEFKTLINELHKNNIRVVMDVVYNHLYDYITTDFQKNIPYYYFRRSGKKMANASGCGNDVASERKMVRRIICDSIRYFLEVFDVDGFRFDLLGLIDIDTSREIVKIRNEVKPDALLYGEGWNMGAELKAEQKTSSDNSHFIPEMGFFNDRFRDVIKGSTFDRQSPGYVLGNKNNYFEIDDVLFGSMLSNRYASFNQSINYVECHDNQTLFDKLSYFDESLEINLKRVKLANAITLFSFGVPFIHMGQEIGQSKQLLDNTYNIPKINNMDWKLVEERMGMVSYLKDLITVRKSMDFSAISSIDELNDSVDAKHLESGLTMITITNESFLVPGAKEAIIFINPTEENISFELDDYYQVYLSSYGIVTGQQLVKNVMVSKLSLIVVVK